MNNLCSILLLETSLPDTSSEMRVVNLDSIPVYSAFHYQCSKYTGRVYVLSEVTFSFNHFSLNLFDLFTVNILYACGQIDHSQNCLPVT